MSHFNDLIETADLVVMTEFADRLRWTKASGATADIDGIIDLEAEFYGPDSDIPYLGKAVTVRSGTFIGREHGKDTLQKIDRAGSPVGPVYRLQRTISDDGSLTTIEVTT